MKRVASHHSLASYIKMLRGTLNRTTYSKASTHVSLFQQLCIWIVLLPIYYRTNSTLQSKVMPVGGGGPHRYPVKWGGGNALVCSVILFSMGKAVSSARGGGGTTYSTPLDPPLHETVRERDTAHFRNKVHDYEYL